MGGGRSAGSGCSCCGPASTRVPSLPDHPRLPCIAACPPQAAAAGDQPVPGAVPVAALRGGAGGARRLRAPHVHGRPGQPKVPGAGARLGLLPAAQQGAAPLLCAWGCRRLGGRRLGDGRRGLRLHPPAAAGQHLPAAALQRRLLLARTRFESSFPPLTSHPATLTIPTPPPPAQDFFPAFFQAVLGLKGGEAAGRMRMHERVTYLAFCINAFQVRRSCRVAGQRLRWVAQLCWPQGACRQAGLRAARTSTHPTHPPTQPSNSRWRTRRCARRCCAWSACRCGTRCRAAACSWSCTTSRSWRATGSTWPGARPRRRPPPATRTCRCSSAPRPRLCRVRAALLGAGCWVEVLGWPGGRHAAAWPALACCPGLQRRAAGSFRRPGRCCTPPTAPDQPLDQPPPPGHRPRPTRPGLRVPRGAHRHRAGAHGGGGRRGGGRGARRQAGPPGPAVLRAQRGVPHRPAVAGGRAGDAWAGLGWVGWVSGLGWRCPAGSVQVQRSAGVAAAGSRTEHAAAALPACPHPRSCPRAALCTRCWRTARCWSSATPAGCTRTRRAACLCRCGRGWGRMGGGGRREGRRRMQCNWRTSCSLAPVSLVPHHPDRHPPIPPPRPSPHPHPSWWTCCASTSPSPSTTTPATR